MQWPLRPAAVEGAAQGLAVNGHDLPVEGLGKGLSPGAEAGLEGVRVDQHEDAPEGVVRGNAVSQAQERPQPAQLVTAIERDVVPGQTHEGLRSYVWGSFGEVTAPETLLIPMNNETSEQIADLF